MGTQDRRSGTVRSVTAEQNSEYERSLLQTALDAEKTIEERRRLGQFSTPYGLAKEIIAYSLTFFDKDEKIRFLDPAFGTGAFYSALLEMCDKERIGSAVGIEIDPHYALPATELWKDSGLEMKVSDFTRTDLKDEFNLLVCNPP